MSRLAGCDAYGTITHEFALRVRVADRAVAQAQLRRILTHIEDGHATVRIIPGRPGRFRRRRSFDDAGMRPCAPVGHGASGLTLTIPVGSFDALVQSLRRATI
uniref:Scr1 family TA system antitoxin-like transcriptional regulator n=1 Tax=Streptomyces tendae TaxID=1932 RepID=UPI00384D84F1